MQLIPEWREILAGAWSVLLAAINGLLMLAATAWEMFAPDDLGLDPMIWLMISAGLSILTIPARVLQQKDLARQIAKYVHDEAGRVTKRVVGGIAGSAIFLAAATDFIGGWEGLRTQAYRDVVGVWTVCYGETKGVTAGASHTVAECDAMLGARVLEFERGLDACLTDPASIPIETKIAMVSWSYNVGLGAACKSTLVRLANAGDLRAACDQLPRWRMAGGRVIQGLVNRRVSERHLCLSGL